MLVVVTHSSEVAGLMQRRLELDYGRLTEQTSSAPSTSN
jgi:ABC-type lipoprotein export system ATPase subunit